MFTAIDLEWNVSVCFCSSVELMQFTSRRGNQCPEVVTITLEMCPPSGLSLSLIFPLSHLSSLSSSLLFSSLLFSSLLFSSLLFSSLLFLSLPFSELSSLLSAHLISSSFLSSHVIFLSASLFCSLSLSIFPLLAW